MPVGLAGSRSHATLIAEASGKAWIYGNVTHVGGNAGNEQYQVAETWDGSICVRHIGLGQAADASGTVQARTDLAANEYETAAILLGRRT